VTTVVPVRVEDFAVFDLFFIALRAEVESIFYGPFVALPAYPILSAWIIAHSRCHLIPMLLRSALTAQDVGVVGFRSAAVCA